MTSDTGSDGSGTSLFILAALLCGTCATVFESMAVGVALPAISQDFDVSAASATWVMGSAQFVIVALLLPMAALGEAVGYRTVYLTSLVLFVAASLLCMLAPSFSVIVAARALQAIGTAGVMSLGFALLRSVFPEDRIGRAIGVMAATVALASSLGPALSGLILTVASWRAIFGLLAAIALIALVLGFRILPVTPPSGKAYDLRGAVMVAAMFSAALVVINGAANGWSLAVLSTGGLAFTVMLWAVLKRSRGATAPVFPVDLIARPEFSLSICASVCAFTAQSIGFILLPFYLLSITGMTQVQMALTLCAWPAMSAMIAPIMGRYADRVPAGAVGAAGLIVMALGFLWIAQIDAATPTADVALRLAVCGVGFAVFQTPNNRTIMLAAPKARSGAASGTLSIARQFGRALGTALAAFALLAGPENALLAMLAAAAISGLGAVASLARRFAKGARTS